jgi:hypothetical protein
MSVTKQHHGRFEVGGKKTVLRSIRISQENSELLEKDAEKKGLSVNALISTLISKYAEWDRYAERFGYSTITHEGLKDLLESIDDESLAAHARRTGTRIPMEITLFWFKKLNLQTFFSFIALQSKYSGAYDYELQSEGRGHTITFHHELGPKYTIWLQNYFDQAIRNIVGVAPKIELRQTSLIVSFVEPVPY